MVTPINQPGSAHLGAENPLLIYICPSEEVQFHNTTQLTYSCHTVLPRSCTGISECCMAGSVS